MIFFSPISFNPITTLKYCTPINNTSFCSSQQLREILNSITTEWNDVSELRQNEVSRKSPLRRGVGLSDSNNSAQQSRDSDPDVTVVRNPQLALRIALRVECLVTCLASS